MARNKYPQRTVEKILEVSLALFNEKGYEKTTIQDIVNALGMSKGAIYHHFKSKDEIIEALSEHCYHGDAQMELLFNASDKTGIEKLRAIIYRQIQNEEKKQIDTISIKSLEESENFHERYGREFECQFPDCGTHSEGRNGGWQYSQSGSAVCRTGADAAIELLDLFPHRFKGA